MGRTSMMLSIRQRFYGTVLPFCLCLLLINVSNADTARLSEREVPESLPGALVIDAADLQQMISSMPSLVLIDTRSAQNLSTTINGALHITEHETSPSILISKVPDKQTPIVFFGESVRDVNNYKTARKVIAYGYVNVFWLRGGIAEWLARGLPLGSFKE